ncbi:hypothetical protein [Streptomyces candidus]|uniref:Uncharacterized protein n=1 Tax=Streptomyces candidus TaxID=67283 RepID=A0A7X0HCI2_9ACTN|nr:hypothetical protein [Streptomyces candidus]MBB6433673.1 hypothetical protein [Streptomyces candidus]GHH35018.1 hypothetical protein GCM10018773_08070 [Streptomyces candidus]
MGRTRLPYVRSGPVRSRTAEATRPRLTGTGRRERQPARHAFLAGEVAYVWQLALCAVAVLMAAAALLVRRMLRPPPESAVPAATARPARSAAR